MKFFNRKKQTSYDFNLIKEKVALAADSEDYVVFCGDNTGANWSGIKNATISMFKSQVVVLPQVYSNQVLTNNDFQFLVDLFIENGGREFIFSGLPDYFLEWIMSIDFKGLTIGVVYHGGLSELNNNIPRHTTFKKLRELCNKGKVNKVAVVKEGLDEVLKSALNVSTFRITLPVSSLSFNSKPKNNSEIHIGVFGNESYNKNRHTQVAAASLIENSIIHIVNSNEFDYLVEEERIVVHPYMNSNDFTKLLQSMDINLYCSYSESWGQIFTESLALGTPCIASDNSGIKKLLPGKFEQLFIDEYDNPYAIANRVKEVLSTDWDFKSAVESLNKYSTDSISIFLNDK